MKRTNNQQRSQLKDSWRPLLHIYKTTKIPWIMLLIVAIMSFGTQIIGNLLIPYFSKIDTGDMKGAGFLLGFIVLSTSSEFLEVSYDLFNGIGAAKMARNIRKRLWGKMLCLPVNTYEREEPQRFVSRVTVDSMSAYGALSALIQLLSIGYGCFLAIRSMAGIYKNLTFVIVAIIPVLILTGWGAGKIAYRMQRMINNAYSKVTNYYAERLPNVVYIKTNNMEKNEYQNGLKVNHAKYHADVIYNILTVVQSIIASIGNYVCLIVILWVASGLVRAGSMTMQQLISLYGYAGSIMANALMFLSVWQVIKQAFGGCEKVADIDASTPENLDGVDFLNNEIEDISFSHVAYQYEEGKAILKDVTFTIPKEKMTVIIGENGCGKSTIMRLLERFDEPIAGGIQVGNQLLSGIKLEQWRDQMGYVFQGNQMILGNVRNNIAYGVGHDYSDEEILEVAKLADAYDFIQSREEGLDTFINPFDTEFSGGQLQRIAIARALMKDPNYLLLDEATSGVDVVSEQKVLEGIRKTMNGKSVIAIVHNMKLASIADHIIVMSEGKIEAEGNYEHILQSSETFKKFLNAKN